MYTVNKRTRCCVPGCPEAYASKAIVHRFPNPELDIDRFTTWVKHIGGDILKQSYKKIHTNLRICHAHFEPKYFCRNNRVNKMAVPTLNLPGNSNCVVSKSCDDASSTAESMDDDVAGPASPEDVIIAEEATDTSKMFSWQKTNQNKDSVIVIDDNGPKKEQKDDKFWLPERKLFTYNCNDKNDPLIKEEINSEIDAEEFVRCLQQIYKCSNCKSDILNYRYACVECSNCDMCGACQEDHTEHYVLRVPAGKLNSESLRVLNIVRKELDICTSLLDQCNELLEANIAKVEFLEDELDEPSGRFSSASLDSTQTQCTNYQVTKREPDAIEAQDTGQKQRKLDSINKALNYNVINLDNVKEEYAAKENNSSNQNSSLERSKFKICKPNLATASKIVIPKSSLIKPLSGVKKTTLTSSKLDPKGVGNKPHSKSKYYVVVQKNKSAEIVPPKNVPGGIIVPKQYQLKNAKVVVEKFDRIKELTQRPWRVVFGGSNPERGRKVQNIQATRFRVF